MRKLTKIWGIRLAAIALVLVVGTAFAVATTYSKYVKSANQGTQTATVAGFGVTMTWAGDFFAAEYDPAVAVTGVTNSVKAATDAIAPGTSGSMTLTLGGTSEVAFTFAFALTETYSTGNWKESAVGEVYHPIDLTVTKKVGAAETTTIEGPVSDVYDAGATFVGETAVVYTITWSWPFEENDTADTYMSAVTDATYSLAVTATATQID